MQNTPIMHKAQNKRAKTAASPLRVAFGCVFALAASLSAGAAEAVSSDLYRIDLARTNEAASRFGEGILAYAPPVSASAEDYVFEYHAPEGQPPDFIGLTIVNESTGRPISALPFSIGNGLAVGLTGTLTYRMFGREYRWTNNNPRAAGTVGQLPAAELGAALTLGPAVPVPENASEDILASLSNPANLSGENLRVWLICTQKPCRVSGTSFIYPALKLALSSGLRGERSLTRPSDLYLTRSGTATISSSCTLSVDPQTIRFGNVRARRSKGPLDLSRSSTVSIACRNGGSSPVAISIDPAHLYYEGNRKFAAFTHENGTRFRGIGLVYAFDRANLVCSGQTPDWRTRYPFGSLNNGKLSQPVYWGLCQLEPDTDTGAFSTTATLRFWVN